MMSVRQVAESYRAWASKLVEIALEGADELLLVTPYFLPSEGDEALSVVIRGDGKSLEVTDGGQILGYFWSHGIDLTRRKKPWHRIDYIAREHDMRFREGEFVTELPSEGADLKIHAFCCELVAIASLVYEFPAEFPVKTRRPRARRKPHTMLRDEFQKSDLEVVTASDDLQCPAEGQLYEMWPDRVSGLSRRFDFYMRNGQEYAIDTFDLRGVTLPQTLERRACEFLAVNDKSKKQYPERWFYQICYIAPENYADIFQFDPIEFLAAERIEVVNLRDAEQLDGLRCRIVSAARGCA